jgi:hypothetical protein
MRYKDIVKKIERHYKKKFYIKNIVEKIDFKNGVLDILNEFIVKDSKMFWWFLKKIFKRWYLEYILMFDKNTQRHLEISKKYVLGCFGKRCLWIGRRFMFYLGRVFFYFDGLMIDVKRNVYLYSCIKKEVNRVYLKKKEMSWDFEI